MDHAVFILGIAVSTSVLIAREFGSTPNMNMMICTMISGPVMPFLASSWTESPLMTALLPLLFCFAGFVCP